MSLCWNVELHHRMDQSAFGLMDTYAEWDISGRRLKTDLSSVSQKGWNLLNNFVINELPLLNGFLA